MENEILKKLRQGKGLTQLDVATLVGITNVGYLNYERGKREPKVRTAIRIAKAVGIQSFDEFCCLWSGNPAR